VWADEPRADGPQGVVFPDQENSLWEFDEKTKQYYLHRFYQHQPDLNVANPEVRDEIARVMGFWMDCPELARGKYEVLATDESAVPSHRCDDTAARSWPCTTSAPRRSSSACRSRTPRCRAT
jgi:hypothetical protein